MLKPKAMVSWSGGKDCYLALQRVKAKFDVIGLFTLMTEDGTRSRSHGLRPEILRRQASILQLAHYSTNALWSDYEGAFSRVLSRVKRLGVSHIIFGDIYPDASRLWAEEICSAQGLSAVEPLFGECSRTLAHEFLSTSAMAMITTIRTSCLDQTFLGQMLSVEMLHRLELRGVDPCGERGEFHTVVTGLGCMGGAIPLTPGCVHEEGGCLAIDLQLAD
jgi:diphthine-ammonia ligase